MSKRVGILSGTFDPVHKGHISFALQAIELAGLDKVIFIPEPKPRHKYDVTHLGHRVAMLELACKAYPKLEVFHIPAKQFTPANAMPRLRQAHPDSTLIMLIGVDVLSHISVWPHVRTMLKETGLVVGVRGEKDERHAFQLLSQLPVEPPETHVLVSNYKAVAARDIRAAIKSGKTPDGMIEAVKNYSNEHWLYDSVAGSANRS